jgi:hypothetical protein
MTCPATKNAGSRRTESRWRGRNVTRVAIAKTSTVSGAGLKTGETWAIPVGASNLGSRTAYLRSRRRSRSRSRSRGWRWRRGRSGCWRWARCGRWRRSWRWSRSGRWRRSWRWSRSGRWRRSWRWRRRWRRGRCWRRADAGAKTTSVRKARLLTADKKPAYRVGATKDVSRIAYGRSGRRGRSGCGCRCRGGRGRRGRSRRRSGRWRRGRGGHRRRTGARPKTSAGSVARLLTADQKPACRIGATKDGVRGAYDGCGRRGRSGCRSWSRCWGRSGAWRRGWSGCRGRSGCRSRRGGRSRCYKGRRRRSRSRSRANWTTRACIGTSASTSSASTASASGGATQCDYNARCSKDESDADCANQHMAPGYPSHQCAHAQSDDGYGADGFAGAGRHEQGYIAKYLLDGISARVCYFGR